MKKPTFIADKIYHVYNRGAGKCEIFLEDKDYLRFIHDLFEFNDEKPALNVDYYFNPKTMEVESRYLKTNKVNKKPRKLLVEILAFTLMPNHFHLLLKQVAENGIVRFMQKLGTGYTMYFNQKNQEEDKKRTGCLFQGRFKAVILEEQAHFLHIPHYIHCNPTELNYGGSTSIVEKMKFLENYRWSSFPDYTGKKNFPSVTQREFLLDFWGGEKKYKKETMEWLKDWSKNSSEIKDIRLE